MVRCMPRGFIVTPQLDEAFTLCIVANSLMQSVNGQQQASDMLMAMAKRGRAGLSG